MTCQYSDFNGKCTLWDDTSIQFDHIVDSCDSEGYCLVEEDEDPIKDCEDYEER